MEYYTAEEIASNLKVHPATVRRWLRDGKLRAVKVGHLWRVTEDHLKEFLKVEEREANDRMFNQWVENGKKED